MNQRVLSLMGLGVALALGGMNHASATTLFAEDFESYAVGTNLLGQGGWFGGGDPVIVNNSRSLPTKVLDGVNSGSGSFFGTARHSIAGGLPTDRIVTLSFDGFASSSGSHDSWTGLSNANDGTGILSISNAVIWQHDFTGVGWVFVVQQTAPGTSPIRSLAGGGSDTAAKFTISVDLVALQTWGTYNFGAGVTETPHFAVAAETIAALDAVNIGFDFRGTRGIQVDNIVVSAVPVPAAFYLMLTGLPLAVGAGRVVRRQHSTDDATVGLSVL